MAKAFGCVYHNKLWKILKEMGIPDCLNLPPEKPVCRTRSNSYNWTWNKGLVQNWERSTSRLYIVTCSFNLCAEYFMKNTRLPEAQAGIKIAGRNINNLRYADDTTLMAESEEELKSFLMRVKEESGKTGLKLSTKEKTKIIASGPFTSWQIEGVKVEAVTDFLFLCSKITVDSDCSHEIKRHFILGRKAMTNIGSMLKSRDITLSTKICRVKVMVFPVVTYRCER